MKKKIITPVKVCQAMAVVLFLLFFQHVSLAEKPQDSFKILALHEQGILVPVVLQYNSKILELNQDRLNLIKDKEWVTVKMMHIQDQNRSVPMELTDAVGIIDYKIQLIDKEVNRLAGLNRKHIETLVKLDSKVKANYENKAPEWWRFDGWVLELLYPGRKATSGNKKTGPVGTTEKPGTGKGESALVKELREKIKAVELGNWVELNPDESRLRLEVQLPILFGSGKSSVAKDYKQFFKKLSWLLKPYPVQIEVAGFTDGNAVAGGKYSSNLELGVSRATNVVKELVATGLEQSAFTIISQGVKPEKNQKEDKLSAAMKRRVEVNVFF